MILISERIETLQSLHLQSGSHASPDDGLCAMEAAAWIAGESHSDHPECVCPMLGAFVRAWNDNLPDDDRDAILKPILPLLIGTRGSESLAQRRALMAADWLVRTHTPAWLRLAKLDAQADAFAARPEIMALEQVPSIRRLIEAVRFDTNAASFALAAALTAALAAALTADLGAAAAAHADLGAAAGAAAGVAAWVALKETRDDLQRSAAELVVRMIAVREAA